MTEGRRAFLERVAGIEGGGECARLAPLMSLLADGELSSEELRLLRPHLKSCLACRARLREYRAAPQRVAALVPPVMAVAGGGGDGPLRAFVESLIGATQDRAHAVAELATGQKVAALAASAAVVAGGGATVSQLSTPDGAPPRDQPVAVTPVEEKAPAEGAPEAPPATALTPTPPAVQPPSTAPQTPAPSPHPAPRAPDPANEFTPAPAPAQRAAPASPPASEAGLAPGGSAREGGESSGGGPSGGEFGP